MKTNIKARITGSFICKTTIMVNKREKNLLYNFYFRQTAILILSFMLSLSFYSFLLFSLTFFVSILLYLRGTHILFCRHIWAELSFLFWTFLSGFFFSGGGGCTCTQCTPLAYAPDLSVLCSLGISYWGNLNDDKSLKMVPNSPKLHRTGKYTLNKR